MVDCASDVDGQIRTDDTPPERCHPLPVVDGGVGIVDGDAERVGVGRGEREAMWEESNGDG